jgi:FAD/FMN-containing dehydrogenase
VSFFASSRGWAADHVVNYELVTADSKVLQVNANSYPDLFWALKGGSSNYGIVTKYDLEVYPLLDVYAGFVFQDDANIPDLVKAISDFVDPVNGGALDDLGALDATLTYDAKSGTSSGMTMIFYNGTGPSGPAAFSNFTKLPATTSTLNTRSFTDWISETTSFGNTPTRYVALLHF